MKSKKVVLAVLMLLIFATNSYSTNSASTNKYDNYPRIGISVGGLNDSMIEIKCGVQMKAFSRHDINGINNFTGQHFTFDCVTEQISSDPSNNTIIFNNFASNSNVDNNYVLFFTDYSDKYKHVILDYKNNIPNIPSIVRGNVETVNIKSNIFKEPNPFEVDDNEMCDIYFNGWPLVHYYDKARIKFHDDTVLQLLRQQWDNIKTLKSFLVWKISNYFSNLFSGNQTNNSSTENSEEENLL